MLHTWHCKLTDRKTDTKTESSAERLRLRKKRTKKMTENWLKVFKKVKWTNVEQNQKYCKHVTFKLNTSVINKHKASG